MRLNKITGSLVAGAMTLSVIGVAVARTGGILGAPAPRLFAQAGAGTGRAPTANVQSAREVEVPPAQQLEIAKQYTARMSQVATTIKAQLEQARSAKDVVKALCLNDKLNQVDVAQRSARDRAASLQSAVQGNDKDRGRHEFVILGALKDRVDQLGKEANQCIGDEAGYIGESQVTLQIDPNIPNNNLDQIGSDPEVPGLDAPVLSSPPL
jgi:hypothetical protein